MKNNMLITPLFFISILIPISSSSWIMIWVGLEINLMLFIFMTLLEKTIFNNECMMKYFLIQAMGSMLFLLSLSMNKTFYGEWFSLTFIVPPLAMMMKSGLAPLHLWVPELVKNFSISSLTLFLTVQKINPIMISFSPWSEIMMWSCIINIIIGAISGINQSSIIKMLVFSSINNSGWMIMSVMESLTIFMMFFFTYSIIIILITSFMETFKCKWMLQIKYKTNKEKTNFYLLMFSLGGLPPLLGFIPKWLVMMSLIKSLLMVTSIGVLFSVLTLFFYIKTCVSCLMMFSSNKKWAMMKQKMKMFIIFNQFHNFMGIFYLMVLIY